MSKTARRIYLVTNNDSEVRHLVRATSQAQAIRHIAGQMFSATTAGQEAIVELLGLGCAVHDAATSASPANTAQA